MAQPAAPTDRDLASIADARTLARRAKAAAPVLAEYSQQQIDAIVDAMAAAVTPQAEALARLAHEETGYGLVADKIQKNLFASEKIYHFIRPMKTVGVINRFEDRKIVEIAEPFGVVAAIVPTTNPTSTAIFKILISLKARCPIVISPHPSAVRCITRAAEIMHDAARRAGAPEGAINWMTQVTLEGTQELMKAREVAVILATGGMGLVRAAYSAGKPAYGVGPGNAPAYIERSADVVKAVRDIVTGKTFDNGLLCSSENSVVVDAPIVDEVKRQFVANGAHFLSPSEIDLLGKALVTPQRLPSPAFVGRTAAYIAQQVGIAVAPGTRVLIAELAGVGRDYPLSIEKLCPVLSFYVVQDWKEGCERCKQILRYGGMGHTMSIHSRNEQVILEFGLKKPAFRIVVNTPTTLGSIGFTTSLDPSMTLGCGGWGGNITSDNISPKHLLNIKRLAYETSPFRLKAEATSHPQKAEATNSSSDAAWLPPSGGRNTGLPQVP
ncbi:MAG: aldehyde dehydrogenase family protein, partial [Vicinamibacterales bacterium]